MIQPYTQTTYESCLACCLLQGVDTVKPIRISSKIELDCVNHSMKFSKNDFVIGHLNFIVKKFHVTVERIVDNKPFYTYVQHIKSSPKIHTQVKKIDLKLIDQLLDRQPIVYIDSYYLFKVSHYPHFITILEKVGAKYRVYDTWDGKEKVISGKVLSQAISSLRNHLKFCPQILLIG